MPAHIEYGLDDMIVNELPRLKNPQPLLNIHLPALT